MPRKVNLKRPKLTEKELGIAYKSNKVYDWRIQNIYKSEMARRLGVGRSTIDWYLERLKSSVGKETREKLETTKKLPPTLRDLRIAHRRNREFDLRMQGWSIKKIAKEVHMSQQVVSYDLKRLRKVVGPETAAILEKPPKGEALEMALLDREYYITLREFKDIKPERVKLKRVKEELDRVEALIEKIKDEKKKRRLMMQRNALREIHRSLTNASTTT